MTAGRRPSPRRLGAWRRTSGVGALAALAVSRSPPASGSAGVRVERRGASAAGPVRGAASRWRHVEAVARRLGGTARAVARRTASGIHRGDQGRPFQIWVRPLDSVQAHPLAEVPRARHSRSGHPIVASSRFSRRASSERSTRGAARPRRWLTPRWSRRNLEPGRRDPVLSPGEQSDFQDLRFGRDRHGRHDVRSDHGIFTQYGHSFCRTAAISCATSAAPRPSTRAPT